MGRSLGRLGRSLGPLGRGPRSICRSLGILSRPFTQGLSPWVRFGLEIRVSLSGEVRVRSWGRFELVFLVW